MPVSDIKIEHTSKQAPAEQVEKAPLKPSQQIERPPVRRFEMFKFKKKEMPVAVDTPLSDVVSPATLIISQADKISTKQIEEVLSRDLAEIYFKLTPEQRQKFKQRGEEIAVEIKTILEKAKINVKKIANIIMAWLKIIPGVNQFFLEQASKIKTDEILKLKA